MRYGGWFRGSGRGLVAVLAVVAMGCATVGEGEVVPKTVLSEETPDLNAGADISVEVEDGRDLSALTFDLLDGGTAQIGEYGGRPLVVNFFAAWCPPCVREMPEFESVFQSLEGEVAFLGLSQDQDTADTVDLVDRTGVSYDIGWDPDLEVYAETGSVAMPTTAFVSPSGALIDVFAGVLDAEGLAERIEEHLGVSVPDTATG